jgi:hypothetical protein
VRARQTRVFGRAAKRLFDILKFRSMVPHADAIGMARIEHAGSVAEAVAALKQERDPRITRPRRDRSGGAARRWRPLNSISARRLRGEPPEGCEP